MKRFIAAIIIVMLLVSVTACGQKEAPAQPVTSDSAVSQTDAAIGSVTGEWTLDMEKMQDVDLFAVFGSGLRDYGSELKLSDDGQISYYIGIGCGGEGTYTFDGSTVTASVKDYNEGDETTETFTAVVEDGVEYLRQEEYDVTVWWTRVSSDSPNMDPQVEMYAYQDILDKYYDAFASGAGAQELMDNGLNYMTGDYGDALENVGFLETDLDGDGISELLVGSIGDNEFFRCMIFDLYRIDEHDTPELVFTSGERNRYYYAGGNKFAHVGSSGADDSFDTTEKFENGEMIDLGEMTADADYVQAELIPFSEWK